MAETKCHDCNRAPKPGEYFHGVVLDEEPYLCPECAADAREKPLTEAELERIRTSMQSDYSFGDRVWEDDARNFIPRLIGDIERLNKRLKEEVNAHSRTIADRDLREAQVTDIAQTLGCEEEWSNLHEHGDCALEAAELLQAVFSSLKDAHDKLVDEHTKLRNSFENLGEVAQKIAVDRNAYEGFSMRIREAFIELSKKLNTVGTKESK